MSSHRMEIKAASREIVHEHGEGTFVALHIPLEHKNGFVFLLAHVTRECKAAQDLVSLLRESVEQLGRSLNRQGHLQHRFEQALQVLNDDVARVAQQHAVRPDQIHAVIGALRDQAFILSGNGSPTVLFLRTAPKAHVRFYDLMQNMRSETGAVHLEKFFATVLDGTLETDDVLVVAAGPWDQYVNAEAMHPLLTTLPPSSALETIERQLPARVQLSILIFQVKTSRDILTGYGSRANTRESMAAMTHTEREVAHTLTLASPHLREAFAHVIQLVKSGTTQERLRLVHGALKRLWHVSHTIALSVIHLANSAGASLWHLLRAWRARGSERTRVLHGIASGWSRLLRRGSVVGIAAAIVLLVAGALTVRWRVVEARDERAFHEALAAIDAQLDEADARLIYDDRASATRALSDAQEALAALDRARALHAQDAAVRDERVTAILNRLRRVALPQLTVIPVPTHDALASDGTIVLHTSGAVSRIDNNALTTASVTNVANAAPRVAAWHNHDAFLMTTTNTLSRYRRDEGSVQTVAINAVERELINAVDIVSYADRLYTLVPMDAQVYRHPIVENRDVGAGVAWLRDSVDVSQATALAVDGTVWIADGATLRHVDRGTEVGFSHAAIDPPLRSAADLWTQADSPYLVVLEPLQSRVFVLEKATGALIAQYVDASFAGAVSLYVNAPGGRIIVVSPSAVMSFTQRTP